MAYKYITNTYLKPNVEHHILPVDIPIRHVEPYKILEWTIIHPERTRKQCCEIHLEHWKKLLLTYLDIDASDLEKYRDITRCNAVAHLYALEDLIVLDLGIQHYTFPNLKPFFRFYKAYSYDYPELYLLQYIILEKK